jgi:hypothetical protein
MLQLMLQLPAKLQIVAEISCLVLVLVCCYYAVLLVLIIILFVMPVFALLLLLYIFIFWVVCCSLKLLFFILLMRCPTIAVDDEIVCDVIEREMVKITFLLRLRVEMRERPFDLLTSVSYSTRLYINGMLFWKAVSFFLGSMKSHFGFASQDSFPTAM